MPELHYDLSDWLRADYPQPKCPGCGRFASRLDGDRWGMWDFRCMTYIAPGMWRHERKSGDSR